MQLLRRYGIAALPTRFSYSVRYGDEVYAHDFESPLKDELRGEIDRFQALMRVMQWFNALNKSALARCSPRRTPSTTSPWGGCWTLHGFSSEFRFKILKPMFVNFVLATTLFDMPAALFCALPRLLRHRAARRRW